MERKKSKFLFDFLPDNTFNHSESDLSGIITKVDEDRDEAGRSKASELPDEYILTRISRHASQWPNWDQLSLHPSDASITTPGAVNFEPFPLTFECGNCLSVNQFRPEEVRECGPDNYDLLSCGRCGETLRDHHQMQFVVVCKCGQIQDMYVPEHCGAGMEFRNPGVGFENAYWRCTKPGCQATQEFHPGGRCFNPECTYPPQDRTVLPHSASKTFYPQTETLINVRKDLDTLVTNDQYQVQIVSDYLLERAGDAGPSEDEKLEKAIEILEEGRADSKADALEMAEDELTVDIEAHRKRTEQFLGTQLTGQELVQLSEELFEYLSVVNPDYDDSDRIISYTFEELAKAGGPQTHLPDARLQEYMELRDVMDLEEVRLIKNFPITTVTYGYSRLRPSPSGFDRTPVTETDHSDDEAQAGEGTTPGGGIASDGEGPALLNLFSSGPWAGTEVFARTTDAEAVMLTLDKQAVLDWLDENGVIESSNVDDVDEWFLSHVTHPTGLEQIDPDEDRISRHVYSLLHTFSHSVIQAIGTLSGYGRDSLIEHLLPRTMSAVIYKRSDTDFSLGSIFTLFEERFPQVVDQIGEAEYCTYDTVCNRDHNSACEDCLFLSDITCQNTNRNLSRSVYFGGPFDGREVTGFGQ